MVFGNCMSEGELKVVVWDLHLLRTNELEEAMAEATAQEMGSNREAFEERVRTAQIEARARNISHNVRCTECGHQAIEESQADIAVKLRKVNTDFYHKF
jgi:cytochrome c-type biogenesis protein CcmH/NrfF